MNISVVLVTFNRLECLKKALSCYAAQNLLPKSMVVLNNASTDGTKDFLDSWKTLDEGFEKVVVHSKENTGGAGGFCAGIQEAQKQNADFLFLADDDAYAAPDMLERIANYYASLNEKQTEIAAICTGVINMGKYDIAHRCRTRKTALTLSIAPVPLTEYSKEAITIDIFSFVGTAIRTSIVREIGLPEKDYFIHHDDTEYALRTGMKGRIVCLPGSVMNHDTMDSNKVTWKDYYSVRNHAHMLKKHYSGRHFYCFIATMYLKKASLLAKVIKKRPLAQRRLYKKALIDAIKGKTGIDTIYYPGARID